MAQASITNRQLSWYTAREPLVILALSAAAVAFFFAVMALSKFFDARQSDRANDYFQRGTIELRNGRAALAVNDFHAALTYSRDSYATQLSLAQALLALHRTEEALQYLTNLWQREPENGMVNFELARIFAEKGDVTQALRYYHNAIYAIWDQDQDSIRRSARLELINFLLARQSHGQAESELIALEGSLPDDANTLAKVGDLFLHVPDYQRALALFARSLKLEHSNSDALAGAGHAAFALGRYKIAEHYLKAALAEKPKDTASEELLDTTRLVRQMDPYSNRISRSQRAALVKDAAATASSRLNACEANSRAGSPVTSQYQALKTRLSQLQPKLQRPLVDSDTLDDVMNLVFDIEQQTKDGCSAPAGKDLALLLISQEHEGD